jgi:transcriptional regulator with XRE-family HTH domain
MSATRDPHRFGELLRQHREARGLSARQAAIRCGLSDGYWGQLEHGGRLQEDSSRRPVRVTEGAVLQIVNGFRLRPAEQQELFAAAGYEGRLLQVEFLDPGEPPPPDDPTELWSPGYLDRYDPERLRQLEDLAARTRFEHERRRRPRRRRPDAPDTTPSAGARPAEAGPAGDPD